MQKYRQKIAIVTLISVLTVILLYINYTIWSGNYIEGDIEDNIRQEMHLIGESPLSDPSINEVDNEIQELFLACLIPVMIEYALIICFLPFVEQVYQYKQSNTLVALLVRLNNWRFPQYSYFIEPKDYTWCAFLVCFLCRKQEG